MKINRFLALALIALMVVGAMGAISYRVFAQGGVFQNVRAALQTQDCGQNETNDTEGQSTAENTNVEEQCGNQNAPDGQEVTDTPEATSASESTDATEAAPDAQNTQGQENDNTEVAPTGTPAITADQAQTAALAAHPGTVSKTELDDENGQLVYSVQFSDGADVKVDAMTGQVVKTETGQD